MDLAGKRVLLTGAAGGLGETAALALAERGATLILSSRNTEQLERIAAELPGAGHTIVAADLSEDGAAEAVIERAGEFDILIVNAGRPGGWELAELPADELGEVVRINFEVPIRMARAAIPVLRARGGGQIVFVASLAGKFALPKSTMYSSTKSGLRTFAWALRPELAREGIGVTLISPGFISEVGMFAKRKRKAPPGAGLISPQRYARQLLRAIEKNSGEAVIAPPHLRAIGQLSLIWPGLFARIFSRFAPQRKPGE
ncbi:MAG: SDR family NAD(P)-dependent oxidoreductase [Actinobacteria bacterium]|nr:SDR family NAD(P)-dependent oxidoreductase [Actinomycetota bacterium]